LTAWEEEMRAGAIPVAGQTRSSYRRPDRFGQVLPVLYSTASDIPTGVYTEAAVIILTDKLKMLISKLSLVEYNVDTIVDMVIQTEKDISGFIEYITPYVVVLANAETMGFETLIFTIQSQQLTYLNLRTAVDDNISKFPSSMLLHTRGAINEEITHIVTPTSHRRTMPSPSMFIEPSGEIVNYDVDLTEQVRIPEQLVQNVEQQQQYQSNVLPINRTNAFVSIMAHIDSIVNPPPRAISPELEKIRRQVVASLTGVDYESGEDSDGMSPEITDCHVCKKQVGSQTRFRTMKEYGKGEYKKLDICSSECFENLDMKKQ
jgi:hypothetical protein